MLCVLLYTDKAKGVKVFKRKLLDDLIANVSQERVSSECHQNCQLHRVQMRLCLTFQAADASEVEASLMVVITMRWTTMMIS